MDTDAFDLQEVNGMGQPFYAVSFFYLLILSADIGIYFSFVIYKWRSFEILPNFCNVNCTDTHNTTLNMVIVKLWILTKQSLIHDQMFYTGYIFLK